jgi:deoxyribose-phosphate aldolase
MKEGCMANFTTATIGLIDLTSLNDSDTPEQIEALCRKAVEHKTAAVCIWPRFVGAARGWLQGSGVHLTTVANFPSGEEAVEKVEEDIRHALADGANEIDVVFPWRAFLAGDRAAPELLLQRARIATGGKTLKVILESGAFPDQKSLAEAGQLAVRNGADFLKTSTGKIPTGATLEAARTLLEVILESGRGVDRPLGFKASGGIRDVATAQAYVALAGEIMGKQWVSPCHFRFGASGLLDALVRGRARSSSKRRLL